MTIDPERMTDEGRADAIALWRTWRSPDTSSEQVAELITQIASSDDPDDDESGAVNVITLVLGLLNSLETVTHAAARQMDMETDELVDHIATIMLTGEAPP